jgi:hypothetical protein
MAMQTTHLVAQQVFKQMELRRARTPAESTVNKVVLTVAPLVLLTLGTRHVKAQ